MRWNSVAGRVYPTEELPASLTPKGGRPMRRFPGVVVLACGFLLSISALSAVDEPPPPWAYGFTTPPPPPGMPAPTAPAAAAARDTGAQLNLPTSEQTFTLTQVRDQFNI